MPAWQLFYQIVTSTKERIPLLTAEIEPVIYTYLREKVYALGGTVFAIGGVEDHVHLVVSVPPNISIAQFTGQVKGYSSAQFNRFNTSLPKFMWQSEYGVFSFDKKRLPKIVDYVERQKEHHRQATIIPVLEQCDEEPKGSRKTGAD